MAELHSIPYPFEVKDVEGRTWHPYELKFRSPDGTYACHIYAISDDHARLQLDALKENGYIVARTIGAFDA